MSFRRSMGLYSFLQNDPTSLENILQVLKACGKGVQRDIDSFFVENDVCDLKDVGDLSCISFDEDEFSFCEADIQVVEDISQPTIKATEIIDDEDANDNDDDDINYTELLTEVNVECLLKKHHMQNEALIKKHIKWVEYCDQYLCHLKKIRKKAVEQLNQCREKQQSDAMEAVYKLLDIQMAAEAELKKKEEEYLIKFEEKRCHFLEELENVKKKEIEVETKIKQLFEEFKAKHLQFSFNLNAMSVAIKQLSDENTINADVQSTLNLALKNASNICDTENLESLNENELNQSLTEMNEGLQILLSIQEVLEKKESEAQSLIPESVECTQIETLSPEVVASPDYEQNDTVEEAAPPSDAEVRYNDLKSKCKAVEKSAEEIINNTGLRPQLARAVGIINQLSTNGRNTNRSKLQQILNLLNGRPCLIGDSSVSTENLYSAYSFVCDQLASRIISLAHDKQVASNAIYASFVVSLWQFHPPIGDLILCKLYDTCPFLVPLSPCMEAEMSVEQFHRSLGLRHKDGSNPEAFDKYLIRMNSASNFYGRIVSMDVLSSGKPHPHGIQEGWKFLAAFIKIQPLSGITASVLSGFLSSAGAALLRTYQKQFKKLLVYICSGFLPLIESATKDGGEADLANLKRLLDDFQSSGLIPVPPEGYKILI